MKIGHSLLAAAATLVAASASANGLGDKPPMALGTSHPRFDFVTASGARPDWSTLRGKVVVMDFWATWCTPCIASFARMNALTKAFTGKPIVFYSVTYETPKMVEPVLERHPLRTTVAYDNDFATFRSFAGWAIPAAYIFDADGKLAAEVNPNALDARLIATVLAGRRPAVAQQMGWDDPKAAEWYFRSLKAKGAR